MFPGRFFVCALFLALAPAPVPAPAQIKAAVDKAAVEPEAAYDPPARKPVAGEPFDDREIIAYLEAEGRKLLTNRKIRPLKITQKQALLALGQPGTEKHTLAETAAQAEAATVVLGEFYTEDKDDAVQFASAAGGFFVSSSGILLTSLHVVNEKESRGFVAMTRDGQVYPIRSIVAVLEAEDLVALQVDAPEKTVFPTLSLATKAAPIGSPITVMSHPDEHSWFLSTGVVSRHSVWRNPKGDEHYTCITADFAKGSSGCPVLDETGNVVAIVNNTESIYYDNDDKKGATDLQMVVKNATPAWIARDLFKDPAASTAKR